jgi:hypothetical protein
MVHCEACLSPTAQDGPQCVMCGCALRPAPRTGAFVGLGRLRLRDLGVQEAIRGPALSGLEARGVQQVYAVDGDGGVSLCLGHVHWRHGEEEVRVATRPAVPSTLAAFLDEQRLAIEPWGWGHAQVALDQVRLEPGLSEDAAHARAVPSSEAELDRAAGLPVRSTLLRAGALAMGTRQEVLGECDERRHRLCATFPRAATLVPVLAFVLARVAPLIDSGRAVRVP